MVLGVFGLPGAGKTTFLTKCAVKSLSGKRFMGLPPHQRVFTTFACPGCYKLDPYMLGKVDIQDSLLLIDEISSFFDSREWKTFPPHVRTWFQLHRHFRCDVIFCSQFFSDADCRLRNLASAYYLLENFWFGFSVVKRIRRFMGVKNNAIVDTYTIVPPILWKFVWRPRYYSYFDSYASDLIYETASFELWDSELKKEFPIPPSA